MGLIKKVGTKALVAPSPEESTRQQMPAPPDEAVSYTHLTLPTNREV